MEALLIEGTDDGNHYGPPGADLDEQYEEKAKYFQVVNLKQELEKILGENGQCLEDIITVIDRRYSVSYPMSYILSDVDREFNLSSHPDYNDRCLNEHPILNRHVVFLLNQGQFIDVQVDLQHNYEGGRLMYSLRFNDLSKIVSMKHE